MRLILPSSLEMFIFSSDHNRNNSESEADHADESELDPTKMEGTTVSSVVCWSTFHNFQIYMAPELLRGRYPSVASDMWAYGVVMYQLLTGRPPEWADAAAESEIEDKYTMMMSIPELNHSSLRIVHFGGADAASDERLAGLSCDAQVSSSAPLDFIYIFPCLVSQDLIKKLLNPNPDLRPTIEEVMSHPWFEGRFSTITFRAFVLRLSSIRYECR